MVRESKIPSQNRPAITTVLVSLALYFTCMKNRITKLALKKAMSSATSGLKFSRRPPTTMLKSTVEAYQVSPVMHRSVTKITRYSLGETMCSAMMSPIDEVEEWEQEDPHDIYEMPVQTDVLDRSVPLGAEHAAQRHDDQSGQQTGADNHVQSVHAGERKVQREEDLRLSLVAFVLLLGPVHG